MKATDQGGPRFNEVIIPIDTIDDIYSDFDLRHIEIRSLSNDFISEVKMQSRYSEKGEKVRIIIIAPQVIRKIEMNKKIQKLTELRIVDYFEDELIDLKYKRRKTFIRSFLFIISGLLCFVLAKLAALAKLENIIIVIVFELISFFSWFATWSGIDELRDIIKRRELNLAQRVAEAEIVFKFIKDFNMYSPHGIKSGQSAV